MLRPMNQCLSGMRTPAADCHSSEKSAHVTVPLRRIISGQQVRLLKFHQKLYNGKYIRKKMAWQVFTGDLFPEINLGGKSWTGRMTTK